MRTFYHTLLSLFCIIIVAGTAQGNDFKYKTTRILYTSVDEQVLGVDSDFSSAVLSNTYENGQGVLVLDGVFRSFSAPFDEDNAQLTSLVVPEGTQSLRSFENCIRLEVLTIPDGIRSYSRGLNFPSLKEFRSSSATADGRCLIQDGVLYGFAPAGLSSYSIPEGVTEIADGVFKDYTGIRSITLPDSIEQIGWHTFDGCSSLKCFVSRFATPDGRCLIKDGKLLGFAPAGISAYSIPDGVTSLEGMAFTGCPKLKELTLPASLEDLGYGSAFRNCPNLACITFSGKLEKIERGYFENCPNLRKFVSPQATPDGRCLVQDGKIIVFAPAGLTAYAIPEGITSIGTDAFCGISGLTSITFPEGLRAIGWDAFKGCSGLSELSFPNTLERIESSAFEACTSLTKINLPASLKELGGGAFSGCSSLKEAVLPESITTIWKQFDGCKSLERVVIPGKIKEVYEGSFENCPSLKAFVSPSASADGRCLIVEGELVAFAPAGLSSYSVPEGVVSIGKEAFAFCKELERIILPSTLQKIGMGSFSDCESLQEVVIPAWNVEVDIVAFQHCPNLRRFDSPNATADGRALVRYKELIAFAPAGLCSYTIPEEIHSIGNFCFKGLSIDELVIPSHVQRIGEGAFCHGENMMIRMEGLAPPDFGYDVFLFCKNVYLFIPKRSLGYYRQKLDAYVSAHDDRYDTLIDINDTINRFKSNSYKQNSWDDYVNLRVLRP